MSFTKHPSSELSQPSSPTSSQPSPQPSFQTPAASTQFSDSSTRTSRQSKISNLSNTHFDVLIVGAGINGAGIARECTLRGLKVAIVDKQDYAMATSAASSKLVHGGLRYLEQGNIKLVFEALKERYFLLKNAPHLVHPLPFLIPIYTHSPVPKWKLKIGLWLYDLLSFKKRIRSHQFISKQDAHHLEPYLTQKSLTGGAIYYDAQMDDVQLCLASLFQAKEEGAICLNYAEVVEINTHQDKHQVKDSNKKVNKKSDKNIATVDSVLIHDHITDTRFTIQAKQVVFTMGPWSNRIGAFFKKPFTPLRPSKGIHIIVSKRDNGHASLLFSSDKRVYFMMPWGVNTLIGTTDTDFDKNPDTLSVTEADIQYLIDSTNQYLSEEQQLHRRDVIDSFAGLRPLYYPKTNEQNIGKVSREHAFIDIAQNARVVLGGKYTTYRLISEQMTKWLCQKCGYAFKKSTTRLPVLGGNISSVSAYQQFIQTKLSEKDQLHISETALNRLISVYGTKVEDVLKIIRDTRYALLSNTLSFKGEYKFEQENWDCISESDFLKRRRLLLLKYKDYSLNPSII